VFDAKNRRQRGGSVPVVVSPFWGIGSAQLLVQEWAAHAVMANRDERGRSGPSFIKIRGRGSVPKLVFVASGEDSLAVL
jgi:hypothetical protein